MKGLLTKCQWLIREWSISKTYIIMTLSGLSWPFQSLHQVYRAKSTASKSYIISRIRNRQLNINKEVLQKESVGVINVFLKCLQLWGLSFKYMVFLSGISWPHWPNFKLSQHFQDLKDYQKNLRPYWYNLCLAYKKAQLQSHHIIFGW